MLIAGGWTYNSIIATKPELEKKIGTELAPAGPSRQGHGVRGRHPPRAVPGVQEQGARRGVHRLHARAGAAEQVHERDRLPAGHDGRASRRRATSRTRSASRSPSSCSTTRAVYPPSPKWGGLEGANIFDGEIQKVMKGQTTSSRPWPSSRRRWTRSSPGEHRAGSRHAGRVAAPRGRPRRARAPRGGAADDAGPAAAAGAGRSSSAWSAIRSCGRSTCPSPTPGWAS